MPIHFDPEQPVSITVLAGAEAGQPARGQAMIVALAGRRLRLECNIAVSPGMPLQIEWSGNLILGEVIDLVEADGTLLVNVRYSLKAADVEQMRRKWV
jgi:hypothetical protein